MTSIAAQMRSYAPTDLDRHRYKLLIGLRNDLSSNLEFVGI
jgi:hypothetical protein